LKDELLGLALGRGTSWGPLADALIAQRINTASAGPVIAPWEVSQLDDVWIDVLTGLVRDLPFMKKGYAEIEQIKDRIRINHPSFSKRMQRLH